MALILLTQDPDLVERLKFKMTEYRQRLERFMQERPECPLDFAFHSDAGYKYLVLQRLLGEGQLDTDAFAEELKNRLGGIIPLSYENAWGVAGVYNGTLDGKVEGGTGL